MKIKGLDTEFEFKLHIKKRISAEDANRQEITIAAILERLKTQAGIILADEVGMGKTYVALGVAIATHLIDPDRKPVVVLVPKSILRKWQSDFSAFRDSCIVDPAIRQKLTCKAAERGEEFLKLLDDPIDRRSSVIFMTQTAMRLGLNDPWIKLALIYKALKGRHNTSQLKTALSRYVSSLIQMKNQFGGIKNEEFWIKFFNSPPTQWNTIINKEIQNRGYTVFEEDEVVPKHVLDILDQLDTEALYNTLHETVPIRQVGDMGRKLVEARRRIKEDLSVIWKKALKKLKLSSSLLLLDEAHHLKNGETRMAELFKENEGVLANMFDRMLFLTATPFQLDHNELISLMERFQAINWNSSGLRHNSQGLKSELEELRQTLDLTQQCSLALQKEWNKLKPQDLDGMTIDQWWQKMKDSPPLTGDQHSKLHDSYVVALKNSKKSEMLLRRWIIRHLRQKTLTENFIGIPRRNRKSGAQILLGNQSGNQGIILDRDNLLPFLLAARASMINSTKRPVFAEGLASSFEAFKNTREKNMSQSVDIDADTDQVQDLDDRSSVDFYLNAIEEVLPNRKDGVYTQHPKVEATVAKALDLWKKGEKVLIFCHYVETGRVLRQRISQEIQRQIELGAIEKHPDGIVQLERISKAIKNKREDVISWVSEILAPMFIDFTEAQKSSLCEIAVRFLQTPTFLLRYFPIEKDFGTLVRANIEESFHRKNNDDHSFYKVIEIFVDFIRDRPEVRDHYLHALNKIQTGNHLIDPIDHQITSDERFFETEKVLPNVRLVNGGSKDETRQRIMLTFNTPFYPDILIASAVMAEGVDLHFYCRHIIHHDLSWNPSTIEQKTGRVDRIGGWVEKVGKPIQIYLPYIAETQDEKMYRVVMERENWFKVIMGERVNALSALEADKVAERLPLPSAISDELTLKLGLIE